MQHAVVYCLPSDGSGGPGLGPQVSVETQNNGSRQLDAAARPLSEQPLDAASGAELIEIPCESQLLDLCDSAALEGTPEKK